MMPARSLDSSFSHRSRSSRSFLRMRPVLRLHAEGEEKRDNGIAAVIELVVKKEVGQSGWPANTRIRLWLR